MYLNPHALRVIRERSGLSVSDLARRAGMSQPHLSNLETGRRQPSPGTVRRLATALQVPLLALIADPSAGEVPPTATSEDDDGPVGIARADDDPGRSAPLRVPLATPVAAPVMQPAVGGRTRSSRPRSTSHC